MDKKKAIITGASRGIGKGIAFSLAKDGCDLALSYYDGGTDSYALEVKREIERTFHCRCEIFESDFQREGEAKKFARNAVRALGGVDILVNNGCNPIHGGSVLDIKEKELDGILTSFLYSNVLITREAARVMVQNKVRGNIINITSGRAVAVLPNAGLYGGMKDAITQMSRSFALDLAPYGIRVNCIAPGYIKVRTKEEMAAQGISAEEIRFRENLEKQVPLYGRAGSPEDIGNAVSWLASSKADYVTGSVVSVDGGFFLPGQREDMPFEGCEDLGWTYFKRKTGDEWPRIASRRGAL